MDNNSLHVDVKFWERQYVILLKSEVIRKRVLYQIHTYYSSVLVNVFY